MTFNIWFPILVNLIIVGLIVAGVFVGRKNGIKAQAIKLGLVCAFGVGIYFLAPVFTNLIVAAPSIADLIAAGALNYAMINSLIILILFFVVYLIIMIVFMAIQINKEKKLTTSIGKNVAKIAKPQGMTKEDTKKLRRQQREIRKEKRKEVIKNLKLQMKVKRKTSSRVFGAIFGGILGLVIAFVVTLPLKPVVDLSATNIPELENIQQGYEYTPFGQLNNWTGLTDKVNKN